MKVYLLLQFNLVFASWEEAEGSQDKDYKLPRCSLWRTSPVSLSSC